MGLASCATLPGPDQAAAPSRTLRQILLPIDPPVPGDRSQPNGRWRDAPLVPGLGSEAVAAGAGRRADLAVPHRDSPNATRRSSAVSHVPPRASRCPQPTCTCSPGASSTRRPSDLFLRACLALNWRTCATNGQRARPDIPVATLGLLHPLARGCSQAGLEEAPPGGEEPELALNPDWAARLAAGQVRAVHGEAAARLRQAGWDAVPAPPTGSTGPRCHHRGRARAPLPASALGAFPDRNSIQVTRAQRSCHERIPHRARSRPRAAGRVAVPAHGLPRPGCRRVRAHSG